MNSDIFDYGDDDPSSSQTASVPNELGDIFSATAPAPRKGTKKFESGWETRIFVQVAVAVALLAVAGGLLARDAWARHARDTAFLQMTDANSRREYPRVIEAAETFLTHKPLNRGGDAREASVVGIYSEALVHWAAQQPGKLDANVLTHIARYKQLVKSTEK
jgi:hypothetical protein